MNGSFLKTSLKSSFLKPLANIMNSQTGVRINVKMIIQPAIMSISPLMLQSKDFHI